MRIAQLIIAHKNPTQVLRLVKRLQHPNFSLFVHVDQKVSIDEFRYMENELEFTLIKNRTTCNWGGNSLLISIINSIKEIGNTDQEFDYINLLSGQDYPLMHADNMLAFFRANLGTNFISFDHSPESAWWQLARDRYERYHFTDYNFKGKYLLQRIVNGVLPKRKFPSYKTLYGGSNSSWWTITGDCAKHLVKVLEQNRRLNKFIKFTWCSDEFIITSIIMNSHFKTSTVNNNLRYIDWSEGKASPKILTIEDLASLRASNMMFARKFDIEVDVSVLDFLDSELQTPGK